MLIWSIKQLVIFTFGFCYPVSQLLQEQGVCMRTSAEMEIVREMKEKCCRVSQDYESELTCGGSASSEMYYTMPDGQVVHLSTERFR